MIKVAMKIRAPQDSNGNPRRGWAIYDEEGYYLGFIDEGYYGDQRLGSIMGIERGRDTGRLPGVIEIGAFEVKASEYNAHNKDSHTYNNGLRVVW